MVLTPDDLTAISRAVAATAQGYLPPYLLAQQLSWVDRTATNVNLGGQVAAANPNRVALLISSTQGNTGIVAPAGSQADPAVIGGLDFAASGLPLILTVHQHGILPQLAWIHASATMWSYYVLEVVWRPPGGQ